MLDDENEVDLNSGESENEEETNNEQSEEAEAQAEKQKNTISADLIRGHINTIILRTLSERDKYGYEIINEIEQKSHGQYELKQPTLYSALKRLENQGYIKAYWKTDEISAGGRRKYFTLTDSGREITEVNRAEWEYSRTVIDSLISDRSFDFSRPAPTPVDFKILKQSTSRVPNLKGGDEETESAPAPAPAPTEQKAEDTNQTVVDYTYVEQSSASVTINYDELQFTEDKNTDAQPEAENAESKNEVLEQAASETAVSQTQKSESAAFYENQITEQKEYYENITDAASQPVQAPAPQESPENQNVQLPPPQPEVDPEERRRLHENYIKLVSRQTQDAVPKENVTPYGESIDTDKLIYNNKPETERDYKNLIDDLYNQTIKYAPKKRTYEQPQAPAPAPVYEEPVIREHAKPVYGNSDASDKAANDGLKIYTSDKQAPVSGKYSESYDLGTTLLKSAAVAAVYLLLLFAISLIFKNRLEVGYAYPFTILAIAICVFAVCAVISLGSFAKNAVKPITHSYLSVSIVISIIAILIVCVIALLINVNFNSVADVIKKMVIPSAMCLAIPLFAYMFYVFVK